MKNLVTLVLMLMTVSVSAGDRTKYSITGKSSNVNSSYSEEMECESAKLNALYKADVLCFQKGFRTFTRVHFKRCKNRLFDGKKIKNNFYFN